MNWSEEDLQDYLAKRKIEKKKIKQALNDTRIHKEYIPAEVYNDNLLEKQEEQKRKKKPSKYHAKRVQVDGIYFDSQFEADYYGQLKLLLRAHEIDGFSYKAHFVLQEGFWKDGKLVLPITYIADFIVWNTDGTTCVIDTKGVATKDYKLKKKMFLSRYPKLEFIEVYKGE